MEDSISRKDYELGVLKYNYKVLIEIIPLVIEKDYKDKVFVFRNESLEGKKSERSISPMFYVSCSGQYYKQ